MSTSIADLKARQVWDSRGRPTVEVEVRLEGGAHGRAIAPSGASTGSREALDRRDGGRRLGGFGVNGALADVDAVVRPALLGRDAADQAAIDRLLIDLDGTPQKSRLGGNAIVATSCAAAWAAADAARQPLWRHLRHLAGAPVQQRWIPTPMIQIFGGGRHAGGRIDIQDYLVLCPGASSFAEAVEWTAEIYMAASSLLARRGLHGVADEGGIWPDFSRNEDGLSYLQQAIEMAGFKPLTDVGIALDVAATSFWHEGRYRLALENRLLDSAQMIDLLAGWCASFPILSIEDPLGEDDTEGFVEFTRRMGSRIQIVGDDYLTTNAASILEAGRTRACSTQGQSVRHHQRGNRRREGIGAVWNDHDPVGPIRRERGRHTQPSRRWPAIAPDQGWLDDAVGADGQVERGDPHRRVVSCASPEPQSPERWKWMTVPSAPATRADIGRQPSRSAIRRCSCGRHGQ